VLARQLSTESSPAGYREIVTRPEAPPEDVIRPLSIECDGLDVWFIRWPAVVVLIAPPEPAPELLRHLSTMATGELLQSDLTVRAKFVGANDRFPTDERAEEEELVLVRAGAPAQ
jgi:hypothetical protein